MPRPADFAFQQGVSNRVTERVIDFLEPIQFDPVEGKPVPRIRALQGVFQCLVEMQAVGNFRERVMPSQPADLLLSFAPLGDVFLNVDPAAICQRLIGHKDHAPAFQMLRVCERLASGELRHMARNPLALLLALLRSVAARLLLDVMANQLG
jgi:hypothetical protein